MFKSDLSRVSLEKESSYSQTILSALFSFGMVIILSLIVSKLTTVGLWQIYYFSPLLILFFYLRFDKLGGYLIKKYPPKSIIEKALVAAFLVLMLFILYWIPLINSRMSFYSGAFITNNWTPGYLIYLAFLGLFLGEWVHIILGKAMFYENELIVKQLIKSYHYLRCLIIPFLFAILIDGVILIPINHYQETHDIFTSLLFALIGFGIALPFIPKTLIHITSFRVKQYFDKIRIMRYLFNKPMTKSQLTKKIENKDKIDEYLSSLLKRGAIQLIRKRYHLSESVVSFLRNA